MISLFYIGIVIFLYSIFTFIFFFLLSSCKDSLIGKLKDSFRWKPISTTICLLVIVLSLVSIYFGYVTPSDKFCSKYYNEDGTTTTVIYSLSGDSLVTNNVTCDRIVKVKKTMEFRMKRLRPKYKVTYKLNNGETVEENYWQFDCKLPTR